jgi:hypothetical protein
MRKTPPDTHAATVTSRAFRFERLPRSDLRATTSKVEFSQPLREAASLPLLPLLVREDRSCRTSLTPIELELKTVKAQGLRTLRPVVLPKPVSGFLRSAPVAERPT